MTPLSEEKCESCRTGALPLSPVEIEGLSRAVPQWLVLRELDIPRVRRCFKFKDFSESLDFANQVGVMSEREDHHPSLLVEWGSVTVSWWTHRIGGLHRNDFVMAAKTDVLFEGLKAEARRGE